LGSVMSENGLEGSLAHEIVWSIWLGQGHSKQLWGHS
jgi:hypothetical protein